MKILTTIIWVLLTVVTPVAFAEEVPQEQIQLEASDLPAYQFPEIKPQFHMYGGYRSVNLKGSSQAEEYQYLQDSVVLGGEMRIITYPHRLHLDLNWVNEKDYDGDISYAYGDAATFRFRNTTLFHNLFNIQLSSGTFNILDSGKEYGIRNSMNDFMLRLKAPDFPAHLYVGGFYQEKSGSRQQISLLGSGSFNNRVRTSQGRHLDWTTKEIVVGANSLLGPVEVDVSHSEKRFSPGSEHAYFNSYASAGATRNAGIYPYAMNPEISSSANTLRLHTLYSGGLSASATITKIEKENKDGGAKADYLIGSGQMMWMPQPRLTFFLKYRHKEVDTDNPEAISFIAGIPVCSPSNNAANNYICNIRRSISSNTDIVAGIVRYRPLASLTLKGEVSYEDIRRDHNEEWKLPDETERTVASLTADARLSKNLKIMAKYTHRDTNNPAANVEPDKSDEGRVAVSWMPTLELNASLGYDIVDGRRNDIEILDANGNKVPSADKADMKRQRLTAHITYLVLKDLSVTLGYVYLQNKVKQDLVYSDGTGNPATDFFVPYKDFANNYTFDISYMPKGHLMLNAGVSHTNSRGNFYPSNLLGQAAISSLSKLSTKETAVSAGATYTVMKTFDVGLRYRYSDLDDTVGNPYDDLKDGQVHTILLTLRKEW